MEPPESVVIFRKFTSGEIIALFPQYSGSTQNRYNIMSYMHVGQHSAADIGIVRNTKLASPAEYAPLKRELESLGYNLIVKKRIQERDCFWYGRYVL
jgi:hypothetical protein